MIKIVILGGGNLAFHLTKCLLNNMEFKLIQVYNRNLKNIDYLKNEVAITNKISELKDADIYIISVSDTAISELSKKLIFNNKLVIHTSGGVDMKDLHSISNKGVFYPLQSFLKEKDVDFLNSFLFFNTKTINHIYNVLNYKNNAITLFDIEFSEGEFIAKEVIRTTMLYINLKKSIPEFTIDREGFLEKVYAFAGFKDIPIQNHNEFSKIFYLLGDNETDIIRFFNNDIIRFFETNPYYHVESNGEALLVFGKERLASVKEIKALFDFGKCLKEVIDTN